MRPDDISFVVSLCRAKAGLKVSAEKTYLIESRLAPVARPRRGRPVPPREAGRGAMRTWRGAGFGAMANAAAAPAAGPVIQHCGIARMKPCEFLSHEMCRPQASRPSSWGGTKEP